MNSDNLFVYSREMGGQFLFDRKLTENEIEYNGFIYKGTLKDVQSRITPSIKANIRNNTEGINE